MADRHNITIVIPDGFLTCDTKVFLDNVQLEGVVSYELKGDANEDTTRLTIVLIPKKVTVDVSAEVEQVFQKQE